MTDDPEGLREHGRRQSTLYDSFPSYRKALDREGVQSGADLTPADGSTRSPKVWRSTRRPVPQTSASPAAGGTTTNGWPPGRPSLTRSSRLRDEPGRSGGELIDIPSVGVARGTACSICSSEGGDDVDQVDRGSGARVGIRRARGGPEGPLRQAFTSLTEGQRERLTVARQCAAAGRVPSARHTVHGGRAAASLGS